MSLTEYTMGLVARKTQYSNAPLSTPPSALGLQVYTCPFAYLILYMCNLIDFQFVKFLLLYVVCLPFRFFVISQKNFERLKEVVYKMELLLIKWTTNLIFLSLGESCFNLFSSVTPRES